MTSSNFMIGPIGGGLNKGIKPFAQPEDSFEVLENAYQFRGRVIRKPGYSTLGRLANGTPVMGLRTYENFGINLQTLVAFDLTTSYHWDGTAFTVLPSVMPVVWSGLDYQFFWTINYANAFWATNSKPGLHGWAVQSFANQAGAGVGATVEVTAAGNAVVVGDFVYLLNLSGGTSGNANNLVYGEVTAIVIPGVSFVFTATVIPPGFTSFVNGTVATGIVLDAFRSLTGQDGIRYYGQLTNGAGWANYNPPLDVSNALVGALLIFAYRGYLVFLNTTEGNEQGVFNYPNRARWTQIGTPYYSAPAPVFPNVQGIDFNTARDDLFGRGGANDAPTDETIVAAGFIRDILIVYFERSTWRLRFVNNSQNPFVWERVNVELGSDATFSTIIFDKGLMAVGNRGIIISDGNDTKRIDDKIPDDAFNIRESNQGIQRVYGIRTFRTKFNYWTYPSLENPNGTYPDKVLAFNYDTKNWSYFDDSFTCFGYYYPLNSAGLTWQELTEPWSSYNNTSWNSGINQVSTELVVAGNQQGYVLQLQEPNDEGNDPTNSPSLSISAINNNAGLTPATFTSANNNLKDGSWLKLTGVTGTTSEDGVDLNGRNFKVANPTQDPNDFMLQEFESIDAGAAVGTTFTFTVGFQNLIIGSCQVDVGSIRFTDPNADGVLLGVGGVGGVGTINYTTGLLNLTFNAPIGSTEVFIRVVSLDPAQEIDSIFTIGVYGGGGEITVISNFNIQTKMFNFFKDDKRSRLSKIDFYTDRTSKGQATVNVFGDSSDVVINTPLADNPFSNVLLTSANPYQVGLGDQSIYRMYIEAQASTLQLQITMSDAQIAVDTINEEDFEILAMIFTMRRSGRLI